MDLGPGRQLVEIRLEPHCRRTIQRQGIVGLFALHRSDGTGEGCPKLHIRPRRPAPTGG